MTLITVMSEGELHVPRLGMIRAGSGFRLVAAMPVDATTSSIPPRAALTRSAKAPIAFNLGSLRAVVDVATGNAVQVMQHDPWGKATTDTLSGGFVRVPFGFAGGIYDEDTKLVRFGAREYDPETGRWLSKDEEE